MNSSHLIHSTIQEISQYPNKYYLIIVLLILLSYGCSSSIKVLQDVTFPKPIGDIFISLQKNPYSSIITGDNPEYGSELRSCVSSFDSLLEKKLPTLLMANGFIISDQREKANVTLKLELTSFTPSYLYLYDLYGGQKYARIFTGEGLWSLVVKFLNNSGIITGSILVEYGSRLSTTEAANKYLQSILSYLVEKSR